MHKEDLPIAHAQATDRTISELAKAFSVDAKALKASRHLVVRNMDIGVIDYGQNDWGRITVFFDLGAVPAARQSDVYRNLLKQNLILPRSFGTFCLIPDNGHVAVAYHFDLWEGDVTGLSLATFICDVVDRHASIESSLRKAQQFDIDGQRHRVVRKVDRSI
jgi:Tir chaperone protein (CesT) family